MAEVIGLPLYEGARTCVRSGYCCKQAPCPFGEYDTARKRCIYLEKTNERYHCSIAESIVTKPGWELAPAFGAGCCSPFNSDRLSILQEMLHAQQVVLESLLNYTFHKDAAELAGMEAEAKLAEVYGPEEAEQLLLGILRRTRRRASPLDKMF